jgi:hypothetical protein
LSAAISHNFDEKNVDVSGLLRSAKSISSARL